MFMRSVIVGSLMLCCVSCSGPPELGTFWRSCAIAPQLGIIAFARGPALASDSRLVANPRPLLCCVLFVCRGREGGLSGTRDSGSRSDNQFHLHLAY
jgi:hypothetical protein